MKVHEFFSVLGEDTKVSIIPNDERANRRVDINRTFELEFSNTFLTFTEPPVKTDLINERTFKFLQKNYLSSQKLIKLFNMIKDVEIKFVYPDDCVIIIVIDTSTIDVEEFSMLCNDYYKSY